MAARAEKGNNRIFTFKVIQSNYSCMVRGFPYRVLAIPEGFTLYQFAEAIIESFNFDFDHMFGFYNNLTRYQQSTEGYELFADDPDPRYNFDGPDFPGVKKTKVNAVFTAIGKKMLFLFDYGDQWYFRVEHIGIEPAKRGKPYPDCVKSVGKARPQYGEPDDDSGEDDPNKGE